MLNKYHLLLTGAVMALTLGACTQKSPDAGVTATKDSVAATVNGTPIGQKQVEMVLKQQASQGMPDNAESRKMIIDNLALQMLVAQEAVKKGMDKVPETAAQLDMNRQSVLAQAFVEDYMKNNVVTDAMLAAEYEVFKTKSAGNQYKARHILVEKEADAKEIIAKIKKDAKAFDGLAKANSKDPGSKDKGGDLGWFDPRSMVPEFGGAVAKLEKGQLTDEPVKSQFGYHVILLDDTRSTPVPTLEQIKPGLSQQLQQQNLKKMLDDMKAKAKIDIVGAPAASASAAASAPAVVPAASAPAAEPEKK